MNLNPRNHLDDLSILGKSVTPADNPESAKLEIVPNKHSDVDYVTRFSCPEFTSLCPITNQPDFAIIVIDYIPDQFLVESKSLKLFLQSFRNYGSFHESCTVYIGKRIIEISSPRWLRVSGYWYPRGGIPIDVFFQTGQQPHHVFIDPIDIKTFRGR